MPLRVYVRLNDGDEVVSLTLVDVLPDSEGQKSKTLDRIL